MLTFKKMLAQYSNRHLVEVICGFQFPQETTKWDSTFFGQYYTKIKEKGFKEKEERKGLQFRFANLGGAPVPLPAPAIEDQVVFKDNVRGWAISMAKNRVSFHVIKNYTNWNDFVSNFIAPFYTFYNEIGLGNGLRNCNVVYLNRFKKPITENLKDFFTSVTEVDPKFGIETNTSIQRIVEDESNRLVMRLTSQQAPNNMLNINLECGAECKSIVRMKADWRSQAENTHNPIKEFFESLITQKLRQEL